jgi:hypothetical protein
MITLDMISQHVGNPPYSVPKEDQNRRHEHNEIRVLFQLT